MFSRALKASLLGIRRNVNSATFFTPRKFYKEVVVDSNPNGSFEVLLDKRKLKTPKGKPLELHSEQLALAIAQEWDAQKEVIHIPSMKLSGLAFTAEDNPVGDTSEAIVNKILEYLDNDTLLYLTTSPAELGKLETEKWLPIVGWANIQHDLKLKPSYSITEMAEVPEESRTKIRRHFESMNFHALTGIIYGIDSVKSVILMLACLQHKLTAQDAASLANLENEYQAKVYSPVEGHHDVQAMELINRLSSAVLFAHLTSNYHRVIKTKVPLCGS